MKANAIDIKNWANSNISPLAWKRIVLRTLPTFNEFGFELDQVETPESNLILEGKLLHTVFESVDELYRVEVPAQLVMA